MIFGELWALNVIGQDGNPTGKLVLPIEHNDHFDQGKIVYQSRAAAECAARRTLDLYGIPSTPVRIFTNNAD